MRVGLLMVLLAGSAHASGGWSFDGTYVGPGLNVGYDFGAEGVQLGAEVSLAEMTDALTWYGVYADGLYGFASESARLSVGAEAGYLFGGLDAGVVYDTDSGEVGARMRFVASMAMQSVYVGTTWFKETGSQWEVGALIKVPVPLD